MSQADEKQIKAAVERYVLAISTSDEQGLRAAFHRAASIIGNYQGATEWLSVDAYVAEVLGAAVVPNDKPSSAIGSIDLTNDAATVKVQTEFGSLRFTDYLSLLKITGEWKIVSKLYHLHQ